MQAQKIIIAGGSGFIGNVLRQWWTAQGHQVIVLTRQPRHPWEQAWDARSYTPAWAQHLEGAQVLINLTGKSVDCRYHAANKAAILQSRLLSTQVLQQAVSIAKEPPAIWLNASSATVYAHSTQHLNGEHNGIIGSDFSMDVVKAWEQSFFAQPVAGVRKAALRMSIVMGTEGGAFVPYRRLASMGLGGRQGSGNQWMSWVHTLDLCRAIDFIVAHDALQGPVNVTAPQPIQNHAFMHTLRRQCGMPLGLPAPALLLEVAALVLRTETELLLKSRNVYPQKLMDAGFTFTYPSWQAACAALL
jgi:uncharacterized protein (TIGR01777 family)